MHPFLASAAVASALVVSVLTLTACPQPRQAPPPSAATRCQTHADCNCGAECGALDACVGGYCEQGRSVLVPCRDGQPAREENCEP